jgi:hypothetical protein
MSWNDRELVEAEATLLQEEVGPTDTARFDAHKGFVHAKVRKLATFST